MTDFNQLGQLGAEKHASTLHRYGGLWVVHHIPKTAGSSMIRELNFCFAPYCNIHYDNFEVGINRFEGLSNALDVFLEEHKVRNFHSCSGHLRSPHLRKIQDAIPDARIFSVLRDLVERLVSEYRYIRTEAFPNHKQMIEKYLEFIDYVGATETQNKQWKFITGAGDAEPSEAEVRSILKRYSFVAVMDRLDGCFEYLNGIAGFPKRTSSHVKKTKKTGGNSVSLGAKLKKKVAGANSTFVFSFGFESSAPRDRLGQLREYCAMRLEVLFKYNFLPYYLVKLSRCTFTGGGSGECIT